MKTSKLLFFLTITMLGVMFAVFAVMAETDQTPSFEVDDASPTGGPVIVGVLNFSTTEVDQNQDVTFSAEVKDVSGVSSVIVKVINSSGTTVGQVTLNDEGLSGDTTAGDGVYGRTWNIGLKPSGSYNVDVVMTDRLGNVNIQRSSTTLSIIGASSFTCSSNADCYGDELCCDSSCFINECVVDEDCVICTDQDPVTGECYSTEGGTCDTSGCYNVCIFTPAPSGCVSNLDCGSEPLDYCDTSTGSCYTAECAVDADCTASAGGTCNTGVIPPSCEYAPVDTTAPYLNIIEPLDVSTDPLQPFVSNTLIVKVQAADTESGIDRVEFEVDGSMPPYVQTVDQTYSGYPEQYWMTIDFTNGPHTIIVSAYDTVGNVAEASVNVEFSLTSNAPIITSFSTDKANYISTETVQVSLAAHDDDSNISTVQIFSSKGGGPIYANTYAQPSFTLTAGIGASSIVDWGKAFDTYAVRQDKFKLPFIKVANAEIIGNQNCTTTTTNYNRYIYAMVADATNPATQSSNVPMVISVTATTCVPVNQASQSQSN